MKYSVRNKVQESFFIVKMKCLRVWGYVSSTAVQSAVVCGVLIS